MTGNPLQGKPLKLISIHIPRVGDDPPPFSTACPRLISIHIPRVGDDFSHFPPVWRIAISIHIPRVGDDLVAYLLYTKRRRISIHIPRVGDDQSLYRPDRCTRYFNPHPPCGG